ncbi:MAG: luciferase domain-containing protein [Bacteroidia bacterium]
MFNFIVKYFSALKNIPLLPHVLDGFVKLNTFLFKREILTYIDEIEKTVLSWDGTSLKMHRYGGIQFNIKNKEIGHIHSNGLMDVLLKKEIKEQLIREKKVQYHHVFANSGWISFYIQSEEDKKYAIELLEYSYLLKN